MAMFRGKAVSIVCTDLERSERFYQQILGARRLDTEFAALPWFELGALTITLVPNASEPSPAEFGTHAMPVLWLEVDDLRSAHAHLLKSGVVIDELHEGEFMLVADPDGMIIEVWQASDA
jgi:catechol 2,3-dioxygenase-like lactoylglutathione lyase family enzyme